MKTPSEFAGVHTVPADGEEAHLRAIFRVFLLASVLMVAALVPFVLALNATATQAGTEEAHEAPAATMLSWVPKGDEETETFLIDDYALTLSTHVHTNGERVAFLRVRGPNGELASIHGQVGYPIPSAGFGVGRLDPKSDTQQVIFTSYTGGLHCCTKITVLELIKGQWRRIELGMWDGDPLWDFPADVDGDGTRDFVLKDDRFDYAFAPYTESQKPPRIFNIEGARVVEVGLAARYDAIYEADMNRTHGGCLKGKNAACAAFVASASRLGRDEWAWQVMLAHYKRATDWDFPTKCTVKRVGDLCPPGKTEQFRAFPDALAWFLTDTGYTRREERPEGQID
jgi:hypothetical protein